MTLDEIKKKRQIAQKNVGKKGDAVHDIKKRKRQAQKKKFGKKGGKKVFSKQSKGHTGR